MGGHQIDRPKPVPQRLSGLVKDGVGGHRRLMQTTLALIFPARWDEPRLIMATAGAAKPIGPLALDDIPQTVPLGAETTSELSRSHWTIQSSPPLKDSRRTTI